MCDTFDFILFIIAINCPHCKTCCLLQIDGLKGYRPIVSFVLIIKLIKLAFYFRTSSQGLFISLFSHYLVYILLDR